APRRPAPGRGGTSPRPTVVAVVAKVLRGERQHLAPVPGAAGAGRRRPDRGAGVVTVDLLTLEDGVDVGTVDRLALEEHVDEPVESVASCGEQVEGALLGLPQQAAHLLVDDPLGRLG